jgi:anti-anti-sigma regulatory factor
MDGDLRITRSRFGPAIVLRMQGALSGSATSALVEELGQLLDQPALLIDLRAVTELDELGFAAMREYLTGAARHGPAFAFLTTRDSRVHDAFAREPNEDAIPVLNATAHAVETVVGPALNGKRPRSSASAASPGTGWRRPVARTRLRMLA